jgi:hypothetical protein
MAELLPKWEMRRYITLWNKLKDKEFANKKAKELLKEEDDHLLSVFFYDLKKAGWIIVNRDEKDKRKKIYKLKSPEEIFKEVSK